MGEFFSRKGVKHALDDMCHSPNFVVAGISWWLRGWWAHSYPSGHRHRRRGDPSYSGTQMTLPIGIFDREGEVSGKEVVSRSGKILSNLRLPQ